MKQVVRRMLKGKLLGGKAEPISVEEVPPPALSSGGVLVKVAYSLISAGTERSSVRFGRLNLLQKARSRPEDVRRILHEVQQHGFLTTYRKVVGKLRIPSALGYSLSGVVLAVDDSVHEFQPGDRVACGGAGYANHADIVFVPKNLCVKLPPTVPFDDAAYTTVGAIAMQGVRQAEVSLGESVCVIGLGLIGQITVQLLKSAGCWVIGVDPSKEAVELARTYGADLAFFRSPEQNDLRNAIFAATRGRGVDAVIITAATPSNDPFVLAGEIARDRAKVVLVGDVKIDVPREPYYRKELQIRLSRSYGPGRYDPVYEERGADYPIGYVRWTERRNMEEFVELLAAQKLNVHSLTTHVFPVDEAPKAYELISGKSRRSSRHVQHYVGVLLRYEQPEATLPAHKPRQRSEAPIIRSLAPALNIGFIGAGSYARSMLLPHVRRISDAKLVHVVTNHGLTAKAVAEQYGFASYSTEPLDVLENESIGTIFIATRHGSHAKYVLEALRRGKNVFVEKPLALNEVELREIEMAFREARNANPSLRLMVGFNRRFAPSFVALKRFFSGIKDPLLIQYRVNAGFLPKEHWIHDPVDGGGRIIGEVCHFVDALEFLTGNHVKGVFARTVSSTNEAMVGDDNLAAILSIEDGSMGVITYLANGDASVPKERIEVSAGLRTAILDNFTSLVLYAAGNQEKLTWGTIEKGQREMITQFLHILRTGGDDLIPFDSLRTTTMATFKIIRSLRVGEPIAI